MYRFFALLATGLVLFPTVILSACGGDDVAVLLSSAPLLDFGEVPPGGSSEAILRVENVGAATAEITSSSISGGDAGLFSVLGSDAPLSIEAGAAAEITLSFTPIEAGTFTAVLELSRLPVDVLSGGLSSGDIVIGSLSVALVGVGLDAGDDDDSYPGLPDGLSQGEVWVEELDGNGDDAHPRLPIVDFEAPELPWDDEFVQNLGDVAGPLA